MTSATDLPEFLVKQFAVIAKDNGFTEYTLEQEAGSKHGDGFIATMMSIKLRGTRSIDGQDNHDELHLICKLLPDNAARVELFNSSALFGREVLMYNTFLPILIDFQAEKGLTEENGFFDFPKCYFAASNVELGQHVIIMDDLRSQAFSLWDKTKPIPFENVRLLMIAMGRFHGLTFALRDQHPDVFRPFEKMPDVMLEALDRSANMKEIVQTSLTRTITMLYAKPDELKRIQYIRDNWVQEIHDCLDLHLSGRFGIINHGDCWNNNMMFLNNEVSILLDIIEEGILQKSPLFYFRKYRYWIGKLVALDLRLWICHTIL